MSSIVIEKLKTVDERLSKNYSTEQLLSTLDELLLRAISAVINSTNFLDQKLITVATWYSTNQRRKITPMKKGQFIAAAMAYILSDSKTKTRIYKKMSLERNLTLDLITQWQVLAKECVQLEVKMLCSPSEDIESRINYLRWQLRTSDPNRLYSDYHTVKYYTDLAYNFREQIAEKYMRKVATEAVMYHKDQREKNGSRMNLNDIGQNFMLAVYKAIDKCDVHKGTLTSYVDVWIKNAKTTNLYRDETGIAYNIPSGQRKQLAIGNSTIANFALSIDDEEVKNITSDYNQEEALSRQQTIDQVRRLAKAVDPSGFGRLVLGIREILSPKEIEQLKRESVKQLVQKA